MIRNVTEYQKALRRLKEDRLVADKPLAAVVAAGLSPADVERVHQGNLPTIAKLMQLGRLLIALCSARDVPQGELARRIGVSEPVDQQGGPFPPGQRAALHLIPNVVNQVLPLIRYELTDEDSFLAEPNPGPWTGRRIAEPQGRLDDLFWYDGDRAVHPHVFRMVVGKVSAVTEYQVHQTPHGADVAVLATGEYDQATITRQLVDAYDRLHVPIAEITLRTVGALERLPGSGKLKRFIPLAH